MEIKFLERQYENIISNDSSITMIPSVEEELLNKDTFAKKHHLANKNF